MASASRSLALSYPLPCAQGTTKNNGIRNYLLVARANSEDAEGGNLPSLEARSEQEQQQQQAALVARFSRRFPVGVFSAVSLAIGANFVGATSFFLGLDPELARSLRLDVLYPVQGFFRCWDKEKGFEFIYPQDWLGDQKILYRAIERAETARTLDLPALKENGSKTRAKSSVEPVTAFGPAGSNGEVNVSVIVAPVLPSFSLQQLGGPEEAGKVILERFIAPPGSSKSAELLEATSRSDGDEETTYYRLEYSVKAPTFARHNVAVYTTRNGQLFSLNVQTPQSEWAQRRAQVLQIANSFRTL